MKYLKYVLPALLMLIAVTSCTMEGKTENDDTSSRIKLKDTRFIKGEVFVIVEVDSAEYLTNVYKGGIVKLK